MGEPHDRCSPAALALDPNPDDPAFRLALEGDPPLASDMWFHSALDYEGHTRVSGTWTWPARVIHSAKDPFVALSEYRDGLVSRGLMVPSLYHADRLHLSGEALTDTDYELLSSRWAVYRRRVTLPHR